MLEIHSKTFRSGNSVAVRLPKELAIPADTEVTIRQDGNRLTITTGPKKTMAELVARLRQIGPPPDGVEKRVRVVPPKRRGL